MSDRPSPARRENEPNVAPNPNAIRFVISRAGPKNWILEEPHGLYGGVFVSKDTAIDFADLESGDREATFEIIADDIERLERKNGKLHSRQRTKRNFSVREDNPIARAMRPAVATAGVVAGIHQASGEMDARLPSSPAAAR